MKETRVIVCICVATVKLCPINLMFYHVHLGLFKDQMVKKALAKQGSTIFEVTSSLENIAVTHPQVCMELIWSIYLE